jgi:hypothetical protein
MDIHWSNSIQIHRPVAQVYAYLADFPRHAEWAQTVVRLEKIRDGDSSGVGAEYLTHERQAMQTDRKPGEPLKKGMKAKTVCAVRALEPHQRIAWHSHLTMIKSTYADWEFRLESDGNGGTRLTQEGKFHFSPLSQGLGRLLDMERKALAQFDAGLQNIKLILEKV